jgi:hypothetical protein
LKLRKYVLVLRKQARRDMGTVARANMRIAIVEVEAFESYHRIVEQLGIVLRIQKRRVLVVVEAVVVRQEW